MSGNTVVPHRICFFWIYCSHCYVSLVARNTPSTLTIYYLPYWYLILFYFDMLHIVCQYADSQIYIERVVFGLKISSPEVSLCLRIFLLHYTQHGNRGISTWNIGQSMRNAALVATRNFSHALSLAANTRVCEWCNLPPLKFTECFEQADADHYHQSNGNSDFKNTWICLIGSIILFQL